MALDDARLRQDAANVTKRARAAKKRARLAKVADRRRFQTGNVAGGSYSRLAPAGLDRTEFLSRLRDPTDGPVLKDGRHSQKIGGDVLVGRLKGARVFTLTLEERATCPVTCKHWRGCYGGNMPHSRRFRHGPALEVALAREVAELCAGHGLVLIRLHILGDFYSVRYVRLWEKLLRRHPNLTVFGFTARLPGTRIGAAIAALREAMPRRFMIRESGRTGRWGAFDITDPFPEKTIGDALVCPEQRENNLGCSTRHCSNCAACWSCDRPIAFIRH